MAKTMAVPSMEVVIHGGEKGTINNQYIGEFLSGTTEGIETIIPFHSVISISPSRDTKEAEDEFCTDIPDYEVADCMESE